MRDCRLSALAKTVRRSVNRFRPARHEWNKNVITIVVSLVFCTGCGDKERAKRVESGVKEKTAFEVSLRPACHHTERDYNGPKFRRAKTSNLNLRTGPDVSWKYCVMACMINMKSEAKPAFISHGMYERKRTAVPLPYLSNLLLQWCFHYCLPVVINYWCLVNVSSPLVRHCGLSSLQINYCVGK